MHIAVVIPTYNEAENLPKLLSSLFALPLDLSVLVVDDNSPDGTGDLADEFAAANPGRVNVLHRPGKLGLSSAYVQGFKYMLGQGADAIAQMDADLSHDPATLITMIKKLDTCDVVFGSRYSAGGSVDIQWPFWRRGLSAWGNFYTRTILRIPLKDITTGYRLWRSETLQGMPFSSIQSKGFIFQVEMAYLAHCLEYRMKETPIYFNDRHRGKSKMSFGIQFEAAFRVWQIWLAYRNLCHAGQAGRIRQFETGV
ncbi:MAG: polyprenol monophosphomannose synthase [Chloroflexi bacterium]|nr:polyprenol monophosphomannose synthase [Chloroflexota bacterium]